MSSDDQTKVTRAKKWGIKFFSFAVMVVLPSYFLIEELRCKSGQDKLCRSDDVYNVLFTMFTVMSIISIFIFQKHVLQYFQNKLQSKFWDWIVIVLNAMQILSIAVIYFFRRQGISTLNSSSQRLYFALVILSSLYNTMAIFLLDIFSGQE
jgi:hypothetical protein